METECLFYNFSYGIINSEVHTCIRSGQGNVFPLITEYDWRTHKLSWMPHYSLRYMCMWMTNTNAMELNGGEECVPLQ